MLFVLFTNFFTYCIIKGIKGKIFWGWIEKYRSMSHIFMHVYVYKYAMIIWNWNYPMVLLDKLYELMYMYIQLFSKSGVTRIMHNSPNGKVNFHILLKKGSLTGNSHLCLTADPISTPSMDAPKLWCYKATDNSLGYLTTNTRGEQAQNSTNTGQFPILLLCCGLHYATRLQLNS